MKKRKIINSFSCFHSMAFDHRCNGYANIGTCKISVSKEYYFKIVEMLKDCGFKLINIRGKGTWLSRLFPKLYRFESKYAGELFPSLFDYVDVDIVNSKSAWAKYYSKYYYRYE